MVSNLNPVNVVDTTSIAVSDVPQYSCTVLAAAVYNSAVFNVSNCRMGTSPKRKTTSNILEIERMAEW